MPSESPPSRYSRPSISTGRETSGIDAEACIHLNAAASALSSRRYTGFPVAQSVATTWNSIGFAANAAASKTSSSSGSSR